MNHPDAMKGFMGWGSYVLSKKNSLPAREREIVILRIGFLCGSGYEWTQHRAIGERAGLTAIEIEAIKVGSQAPNWSGADAALLAATDDLHKDHFVSEASWAALREHFSPTQCMDVVFTAGQYTQVSMILNSLGVQLDEGQVLDPDLDRRKA
jgi:alkylhydroperoxidase family enzyme